MIYMDNAATTRMSERAFEAMRPYFMEQYANALPGGEDQTIAETAHGEFPKELDDRCRKLIAQERGKLRRKRILRSCLRVCRSAAVLALVLMCVGTTLLFTVESFRIPVANMLLEWTDKYVEISSPQSKVMSNEVGKDVDFNDPLRQVLELDFELVDIENHWEYGMLSAEYKSPDATVMFFVGGASGVLQIDTEGATVITPMIMNYEVMMVKKDDSYALTWIDEPHGRMYELYTTGLSELDVAEICSQIILLFEG